MRLNGKYAVVTGASSGIGRALVPYLLKEGAFVLAVSRTIEETMDITHARLWLKNIDLKDRKAIDALFEHAMECFGTIDVFIANAGFAYYEPFEQLTYERIQSIMATNVTSVFYSAMIMKTLNETRAFNFMVTASAIARLPMAGFALYGATKAAVDNFIRAANLERVRKDHTFQAVFPIATNTRFFHKADAQQPWPVQTPEKVARKMIRGLKRNKKEIHPFPLLKWTQRLCPVCIRPYVLNERRKFYKSERDK
ncbi:MAG: SDR family NAD(P)-dependent oxidoreductase [Candidatus Izemoplasmataceae bacterium]